MSLSSVRNTVVPKFPMQLLGNANFRSWEKELLLWDPIVYLFYFNSEGYKAEDMRYLKP